MKNTELTPLSSSFAAIPFSLPRRIAASAAITFLCASIGLWFSAGSLSGAPMPLPVIEKGNIEIELETVVTGIITPIDLEDAGDGSGRLFIVEQAGTVQILKDGVLLETPFLDVSDRLVEIFPEYDERGLLGLAFHPDFNVPSSPGYHKLYSYTSEPATEPADFNVPNPDPFDHQDVIAEWQVSADNPDVVDPNTRREVVRINHPQFNHNSGHLLFGPDDHYLYFADGDGGNANDVGPGHNDRIGNAQDLTVILGKMLRIDPLDPNLTPSNRGRVSKNHNYRIPRDNPFFFRSPGVREIFAYGLRNPFRSSFDAETHQLIIADVGQNNIEEVNFVEAGDNLGWNRKEGSFLFNPNDGTIRPDHHPDPELTSPVAEYSHADGIAVIGGFVYRGALAPLLSGKYVFGDLLGPEGFGRLFYSDLSNGGVIFEFQIGPDDESLGAFLKGFGQDANNEVYILTDTNIGPSGTGGEVRKIVGATIIP